MAPRTTADGLDPGPEAATFPLVEVDATYYALPSAATARLWVERTPPDFIFDIKSHALMTGQGPVAPRDTGATS
jgi:uncharacterized protein YecE (DUF72 family)